MDYRKRFALAMLGAGVAVYYAYAYLHALGPALVGQLAGGVIVRTRLVDLAPVIEVEGAVFTQDMLVLFYLAGLMLPCSAHLLELCFYKRDSRSLFYHCFMFVFTLISMVNCMGWVTGPLQLMLGGEAIGDAALFVQTGSLGPLSTAICGLCWALCICAFAIRKGVLAVFIRLGRGLRTNNDPRPPKEDAKAKNKN